ncbi:MAG: Card1-like endonuclease domain-containing protein [Thermodesulfovibrionales bacterium]
MSHLHVCLVSDQPIPNLTTVLQFKPEMVILLKTKEMDEKARLLEDVLKKKNYVVQAETIEAYDINNVINVSESLINKCKGCDVSLNITGGTKIGTLGTFQAFYTSGKAIYYVDTKDNKILQISPEQKEIPIEVSISIADYLAVYGFQISDYVKDDGYIFRRKELTKYLANTVINNPHLIPAINSALHSYNENTPLPITVKLPYDKKLLALLSLLDGVTVRDKNQVIINDHDSLKYLKGIWFEEYVYMIAKALNPDEMRLNVKGRWITRGQHSPKNEFDVMIAKGNRLFLISCKTANPDRVENDSDEGVGKEFLYELDSLGDRALGLFGKRMLVSSRPVNDPAVRERAKIFKVELIDGKNILTLKENLQRWLKQ